MTPGANGFAVATFPGEQECYDTEMPNALLSIVPVAVMKRPAAPLSRKLVKQAKKAAKVEEAANDDDDRDEVDGESEEADTSGKQPVDENVPATQEYPEDVDSGAEVDVPFDESLYSNRKAAFDKDGKLVPWKTRLQSRPLGCVKCRAAPGCAPSCWSKSKQ
jgi:hypothetical protein